MAILFSYLIKAVIASGILYGYYLLALKNKRFHAYNRFYLLGAIGVSLAIPFVRFEGLLIEVPQHASLAGVVSAINSPDQPAVTGMVLTGAGILVSSCLLGLLMMRIRWIYRLKNRHANISMPGFTLIETETGKAPFSFLRNLFWKRGMSATDTNGKRIFRHELAHIRQKHTYDKLFAQVVCCIAWMNPFYWLIQKELNTVHEFIADEAAVEEGDTESFARMLLYAHNDGHYLSPAHPFFNSSIKRRLIMITTSKQPSYSFARRILVLPIAFLALVILSVQVRAQTSKKENTQTKTLELTPAKDTVPKLQLIPSVKPEAETVTVVGRKTVKPSPEPIMVEGHQLEPAVKEVTVVGYQKPATLTVKPIPVVGVQLEVKADAKPSPEPVVVVGHKTLAKPSAEPVKVKVTGVKLEKAEPVKEVEKKP